MLRVYMDGKLKREERGEYTIDLDDRGRNVCGVEIPQGRTLAGRPTERRGKRVHRIDIRTAKVDEAQG